MLVFLNSLGLGSKVFAKGQGVCGAVTLYFEKINFELKRFLLEVIFSSLGVPVCTLCCGMCTEGGFHLLK